LFSKRPPLLSSKILTFFGEVPFISPCQNERKSLIQSLLYSSAVILFFFRKFWYRISFCNRTIIWCELYFVILYYVNYNFNILSFDRKTDVTDGVFWRENNFAESVQSQVIVTTMSKWSLQLIEQQTCVIHHAETSIAVRDFAVILVDGDKDISGLRYVLKNSTNIIKTDFICTSYNANIIFHCDKSNLAFAVINL